MLWQTEGRLRWFMYHLEKSDVELLKTKWDKIEGSLKNDPGNYSGSYIIPAYMSGYFLNWSEREGYVFVRFFDVEHPCYFSFGDVEIHGSTIKFIHKGESIQSACPSNNTGRPAEEWVPALGGEYFVPVPELAQFADYYAGFGEFNGYFRKFENHPAFAIKSNWKSDQTAAFILPKDFSHFVKAPLNGQITSVGKTRRRPAKIFGFRGSTFENVTGVTINIGRQHGLKGNQEFALLSNDTGKNETLVVTSVGKTSSKGIVIREVNANGTETYYRWSQSSGEFESMPFAAIRPGIRVTTSPLSKL